jgi:hypothetical protein
MHKLYLLLIYILFFLPFYSFSQRKFKRFNQIDGFSINPIIGFGSVVGELGDIFTFKPVFGVNVEKGISERINIGVEIIGGTLSGSENVPYFSRFENDYFQVQSVGVINLSRYLSDSYIKKKWEFKFYAGVGLIWFHTDVYDLKSGFFLRTTADGSTKHTAYFQQSGNGIGEAGIYYTRELVVPFGFRVDGKLKGNVNYSFNLGYNWVYNDKLDGTTNYNIANPNIIGGVNSYSDTANDAWINLSVGFKYIFSVKNSENQRGV